MERMDESLGERINEKVERMHRRRMHNPMKTLVFGLLVVLFGLALLLNNTGLLNETARHVIFSWQMLIIAIGVLNLFDRSRFFGSLLILIGLFFMLTDLFILPLSLHHIFWPAVIILIGLFLIFGRGRHMRDKYKESTGTNEDIMDYVAIFGGGQRTVTTQNFSGGRALAIFGGGEINLVNCKLAEGNHVLDLTCVFGGITLIVPPDWHIISEVVHILGGSDDKRPPIQVDPGKTLTIKGFVMFGGTEIKSY